MVTNITSFHRVTQLLRGKTAKGELGFAAGAPRLLLVLVLLVQQLTAPEQDDLCRQRKLDRAGTVYACIEAFTDLMSLTSYSYSCYSIQLIQSIQ